MNGQSTISIKGSWNQRLVFQISVCLFILFWSVSLLFYDKLVPESFIVAGLLTSILFFILHHHLGIFYSKFSERRFILSLGVLAVVLRVGAAIALYYFYSSQTGEPFEYNAVDSKFYHHTAIEVSKHIRMMDFNFASQLRDVDFSDRGYNIFLGFIYSLFGPSILAARLVNAILSGLTVLLVYRIAWTLYNPKVARSAGISALLLPNLMLYLGTHLKETVMVFLAMLFLYQSIRFIKLRSRSWLVIFSILFLAYYLFMFRTILGVVCVLSFCGYATFIRPLRSGLLTILSSSLLILVLGYFIWNSDIGQELAGYLEKSGAAISDNMQFRATRDGGNKFALLAGAPLFASVIVIAPFPSFVYVPEQDLLWMFIGANLIRNIYALFAIAGIIYCFRKDFRNSSILIFYALGYLLILANSGFAISERFHMPVVPALLILASLGLSTQLNRLRRIFPYYLLLVILLVIGWNYVKLAGRI